MSISFTKLDSIVLGFGLPRRGKAKGGWPASSLAKVIPPLDLIAVRLSKHAMILKNYPKVISSTRIALYSTTLPF